MDLEQLRREWKNPAAQKGSLQAKIWDNRVREYTEKRIPSKNDNPFLKFLWEKAEPDAGMQVLDIGCGAGLYALSLAAGVNRVVGTDVSSGMIDSAKKRADTMQITNVEFQVQDWSAVDPDQQKFRGEFDIVFAHMTPAVCDYHTLEQMNACAKGHCFLVKPARRRDAVQDGAFAPVGICGQEKQMDDTILNTFTYLWLKGYTPELVKRDEVWTIERSLDEMTEWCVDRAGLHRELTSEEKKGIRQYVEGVSEEGRVQETVTTTIVTMYWHV